MSICNPFKLTFPCKVLYEQDQVIELKWEEVDTIVTVTRCGDSWHQCHGNQLNCLKQIVNKHLQKESTQCNDSLTYAHTPSYSHHHKLQLLPCPYVRVYSTTIKSTPSPESTHIYIRIFLIYTIAMYVCVAQDCHVHMNQWIRHLGDFQLKSGALISHPYMAMIPLINYYINWEFGGLLVVTCILLHNKAHA